MALLRPADRFVEWLVCANVNGTNRDRQALHTFNGLAVRGVLLFFIRQLGKALRCTAHEQKFTAEKAHADGSDLDGASGVVRHFDVGQQLNALAVNRQRGRVLEAIEPFALQLALALLEAIFSQDDGRRVHNQHAHVSVNNHPVILFDELAGTARADHGRDVHAAGDNRGVRYFATHISGKTGKQALLELQHVGGGNVMRDQHQRHIFRVVQQQPLR